MHNRHAPKAAGIRGVYATKASNYTASVTLLDFIAGNSDFVSQPAPGDVRARHDFQTRTIIGPRASLVIDGTPFTPAVGDRWTETIFGEVCRFEVTDDQTSDAATFSDTGRTRIRIRLKRVN